MGNQVSSWLSWAADTLIPHPPAEGGAAEPGAAWRSKAAEHARLRSSAFDESQRAYKLGRRAEAKQVSHPHRPVSREGGRGLIDTDRPAPAAQRKGQAAQA
jgi:hypothetical protein